MSTVRTLGQQEGDPFSISAQLQETTLLGRLCNSDCKYEKRTWTSVRVSVA